MTKFRLSAQAERDLHNVFVHGIETFGEVQAVKYQAELEGVFHVLADFPSMCRERPKLRPPLRVHHHERHYIAYTTKADHILILRVIRDEADLARHLQRYR